MNVPINIFRRAIKGWDYTLRLWDYYMKIDIILMILFFICGFLGGLVI